MVFPAYHYKEACDYFQWKEKKKKVTEKNILYNIYNASGSCYS